MIELITQKDLDAPSAFRAFCATVNTIEEYSPYHTAFMAAFHKAFPDGKPTEATCQDGIYARMGLYGIYLNLITTSSITEDELLDITYVVSQMERYQDQLLNQGEYVYSFGHFFNLNENLIQIAKRKCVSTQSFKEVMYGQ
ncbi:hypothetical protein ACMXYX_17975 (plasmid) [Neptuniibacter sp. QD72_48]|uniref:hypothetical protein n=1 Tax=Neptuniibacter sp. QD72_48 TaxID=3398214 RepID=UPI0039F5B04A